jgi:hypothetical protein
VIWARDCSPCCLARCAEETGDSVGDLGDERVRSAYLCAIGRSARALSGRRQLGLDPLSAARLSCDKAAVSVDVAQLVTQLHRLEAQGVDVLAATFPSV